MAKLALKPDSNFFRKIAIGAVGTRAVCTGLSRLGHDTVELERGSTDTKLWKDVKRKRVRIPDLVCRHCGLRIESRAKNKADLSMSHSPADAARTWDFGMVDNDCIAFPVCQPADEDYWSTGHLGNDTSYWHERNWVHWIPKPHINYFSVATFRSTPHARSSTKGVTEGSETSIAWDATFSTRDGRVEAADAQKVTIRRNSDGHRYTWRIRNAQRTCVSPGDPVRENQVLASTAQPIPNNALQCGLALPPGHLERLLTSRERTQRFTGVKLARLRRDAEFEGAATQLLNDCEEDVYVRLEGASYLASVCQQSATQLFEPFCNSIDEQTQLEAVIALGEAGTDEAVTILCDILDAESQPYFLRSAAAWCLSKVPTNAAWGRLVRAFSDVNQGIREQALDGIVSVGGPAVPLLLEGLRNDDMAVAAGCAESLRQQSMLPKEPLSILLADLRSTNPSPWTVWLLGHLPREHLAASIAGLQQSAPHLHYAISVLWSFVDSWISRRWELRPHVQPEVPHDV